MQLSMPNVRLWVASLCGALALHLLLRRRARDRRACRSSGSPAVASHLKCVAVDLDGTLWPGVLAEGLAVAHAGWAEHRALQIVLKEIETCGVLLVSCSRNDEQFVLNNWPSAEMCSLRPDNFVGHCFGWRPKSERLREFAAAVGVKHESLLFIDDRAQERDEVRAALPTVR
jgi:FkbH-like protein